MRGSGTRLEGRKVERYVVDGGLTSGGSQVTDVFP